MTLPEQTRRLERIANRKKRARDKKFHALYRLLHRILNRSTRFLSFDLAVDELAVFNLIPVFEDDYVADQVVGNALKFESSSPEQMLVYLREAANVIRERFSGMESVRLLCHGVRNGSEMVAFRKLLGGLCDGNVEILGTDIAPTIRSVHGGIQHDFHEPLPESVGNFHIIFSNSIDQARDPRAALRTWIDSLRPGGLLILQHGQYSGKMGSARLDPFSCEPELLPFLIMLWFGDACSLVDVRRDIAEAQRLYLFVLQRKN